MSAVERVAVLVRERNRVDAELSAFIGRPALTGHLGAWIAAQVFGISDGRLGDGRTVGVRWYTKREGLLDVKEQGPDFYLVLAGPKAEPASSRGTIRPLVVDAVYLFDAAAVVADLRSRGLKIGVASSVRAELWEAAEIYPRPNPSFPLSSEQREQLALFGS